MSEHPRSTNRETVEVPGGEAPIVEETAEPIEMIETRSSSDEPQEITEFSNQTEPNQEAAEIVDFTTSADANEPGPRPNLVVNDAPTEQVAQNQQPASNQKPVITEERNSEPVVDIASHDLCKEDSSTRHRPRTSQQEATPMRIVAFKKSAQEIDDFLPEDTVGRVPPFPHPFWHPLRAIAWIVRMLFGIASLILMLAVIAAIPVVNFLALGYLLEVEGRMARTGKLRFAFPLLDLAPRLGSIVIGVWLFIFPLRLLSWYATNAHLIEPGSRSDVTLNGAAWILSYVVTIHLCLALARGGSLGCFLRPLKNVLWLFARFRDGDYWKTADQHITQFISDLRLKHHFWLGVRGFFGAAIWLIIPTALFSVLSDTNQGGQILLTLLGGAMLLLVFTWMPFLQARFAAENRFGAMFELRTIRELFCHAPFAWLISIVFVFVLALPLYLFKVALPPQDAMWGVTIVFIVSIYPAKVITGWAYHRAIKKPKRSFFGFRWVVRMVMLPLIGAYVLILFFTQAIGAEGKAVLFQHHAFMLPVPF